MSYDAVTLALALLSLVADVLVVVALVLMLGSRLSSSLAAAAAAAREAVAPVAVPIAWLVAAVATSGSLYFSEVIHFVPCRLCWYQRIAMYPLVLLLGIAALRRDSGIRRYAGPLAVAGGVIAAYHYQLERFPNQASLACSLDAPCSAPLVDRFGFISIPYMALSAFALVAVLMLVAWPALRPTGEEEAAAP